ncbi:MAG: DUF2306 domain-containing protein [Bacteroidetes bacterium]|nr:DUF2306 domain-containing protein [Bacteroidota bacterium]
MGLYQIIKIIHILAGATALITGLIAMLTRKGGKAHRLNGKLYFWSMAIIFVSSIYMSLYKEMIFFVLIAFFSFQAAFSGYRILYLKKLNQGQKAAALDYVGIIVGGIAAICMLYLGIVNASKNNTAGIVLLVFGVFYALGVWQEWRKFSKPPTDKMFWYYKHIGQMGGAYIATTTAFLVNNYRLFPFIPGVVLWLLPTAVGVVIITRVIKKYKKQYSDKA